MMIQSVLILGLTSVLLVGVITATFYHTNTETLAQEKTEQICCQNITSLIPKDVTIAKGSIASLQNGNASNMTWIAYGNWNISKINSTSATFYAKFDMIKTDSSEKHKYRISKFKLTNSSVDSSSSVTNGTANVQLDRSSVKGVPVSIKIMDKGLKFQTLSIWIDPERVQNIFGNTSIYGTVRDLVR